MSAEKARIGKTITLIDLAVQLFFFASFATITAHGKLAKPLYITLGLLYVRSIYRIAEDAGGFDGPISSAEWAFYVFDTFTVAIAFVVYPVYYIGDYLPKRDEEEQTLAQTVSFENRVYICLSP